MEQILLDVKRDACDPATMLNACSFWPRWRHVGLFLLLMVALTGCAARVQNTSEEGQGLTLPSVKVPLLKFPLTNRQCSNSLIEDLLPEPDQVPQRPLF